MKRWTLWILIVVTLALIGYDIYAVIREPSGTISAVLLGYARKYPSIPFCFGVLMGHLFWAQTVRRE